MCGRPQGAGKPKRAEHGYGEPWGAGSPGGQSTDMGGHQAQGVEHGRGVGVGEAQVSCGVCREPAELLPPAHLFCGRWVFASICPQERGVVLVPTFPL